MGAPTGSAPKAQGTPGQARRRRRTLIGWLGTPIRALRGWIAWLLKMPASLLATVVVAVLTVVVGPALVHQWDDRQKVRDLKAEVADQIVTSMVRTLNNGVRVSNLNDDVARQQGLAGVGEEWDSESIRIRMKLRAYFPEDVVETWKAYDRAIHAFLDLCTAIAPGRTLSDTPDAVVNRRSTVEEWVRQHRQVSEFSPELAILSLTTLNNDQMRDFVTFAGPGERASFLSLSKGWMRTEADQMTDVMLSSHLEDFSTTGGDLLDDIIPDVEP
jgi:hypothetical protein